MNYSINFEKKSKQYSSVLPAFFLFSLFFFSPQLHAQDTTIVVDESNITLPTAFVRSHPSTNGLLRRIKNDSSFYKAFRTLHVVGFTADNNIQMLDKKGRIEASYKSLTKQIRTGNCRHMEVLKQNTTGKMVYDNGQFKYTTAKMYESLFLTKGIVCGETNIVSGKNFELEGKSGLEKHKEQLKILFFNPGRKIPGIPFIGNKLDLYDDAAKKKYDYRLDTAVINGQQAFLFTITPKPGATGIVINKMSTWFDMNTMEVLGRNYSLHYSAGVYHFDVLMKVLLDKIDGVLVPIRLQYKGDWGVILKGSERGEFDAQLRDFKIR